jgi:GT2 family glycosyltransferase
MTISAVIVNYKTGSMVEQLCGHLLGQCDLSAIVVVDNSGEIEKDFIENRFSVVKVLDAMDNLGFGKGVNLGLQQISTEWALVVNPDVRLEKKCLSRLLVAAQQFGAGLVGPRFYWDEEHLFRLPPATGDFLGMDLALETASFFELDARLVKFYWQIRHERFWAASKPFMEPFLSGACLLVHMPKVKKKGGLLFDERFFLYYEDTDLCAEAVLDYEYPLCIPGADAIHYYNQSPAPMHDKAFASQRSREQFLEKYYCGKYCFNLNTVPLNWDIPDMGEVVEPPVFELDADGPAGEFFFFEIAMNQLFVPFVQCHATKGRFYFPEAIWEKLAPGRYYSRTRNPYTNQEKVWKWVKRRY